MRVGSPGLNQGTNERLKKEHNSWPNVNVHYYVRTRFPICKSSKKNVESCWPGVERVSTIDV